MSDYEEHIFDEFEDDEEEIVQEDQEQQKKSLPQQQKKILPEQSSRTNVRQPQQKKSLPQKQTEQKQEQKQIRQIRSKKMLLPQSVTKKSTTKSEKEIPDVDFKNIQETIREQIPSLEEFENSLPIQTLRWFIENIPSDKVKTLPGVKKNETPQKITLENFHEQIQHLHEAFSYIFIVNNMKKFIQDNYDPKTIKCTTDGRKYTSGRTPLFEFPQEEFKQKHSEFNKIITTFTCNINENLLKDDLAKEFIMLPINETENAFDHGKGSDFCSFQWNYSAEDFQWKQSSEEEKNILYKELFSKNNLKKPWQVFSRRISFIGNLTNENIDDIIALTVEHIDDFIKNISNYSFIPEDRKLSVADVARTIKYMIERNSFRRIMFEGIPPTKILAKTLERIFNSKEFGILLDFTIKEMSFLFTPRQFCTKEILDEFNQKEQLNTSLTNRRKILMQKMLSTDGVADAKNNEFWIYFLSSEEVNPWEVQQKDFESLSKKSTKQTPAKKKQTSTKVQNEETQEEKYDLDNDWEVDGDEVQI